MKAITEILKTLIQVNNYNADAFYTDMFDDPMIVDLENKLGRQLTDEEAEWLYENLESITALENAKVEIQNTLNDNGELALLNAVKNGDMDSSIAEHLEYAAPYEIAYTIIEHGGI